VQELRRYIKLFRDSGKFTIAYMKTAGEKEYYLASAFQELLVAPTANIRLAGFSVAGGQGDISSYQNCMGCFAAHGWLALRVSAVVTFSTFQ
jgi:hypothetical protein